MARVPRRESFSFLPLWKTGLLITICHGNLCQLHWHIYCSLTISSTLLSQGSCTFRTLCLEGSSPQLSNKPTGFLCTFIFIYKMKRKWAPTNIESTSQCELTVVSWSSLVCGPDSYVLPTVLQWPHQKGDSPPRRVEGFSSAHSLSVFCNILCFTVSD